MIRQFTSKNQQIGERGERIAAISLMRQGFSIVERNVANKYGEIDIVAKKTGTYHFYEVKACTQGSWFNPAENMTPVKRRKFLVSVEHYCLGHRITRYQAWVLIVKLSGVCDESSSVECFNLS